MTYQNIRGPRRDLKSAAGLDNAMRTANLSGRELARRANTTPQTISDLRCDHRISVTSKLAARIERALGQPRGALFGPDRIGGRPLAAQPDGVEDQADEPDRAAA